MAPYLGVAPPAMVEKLRELADRYYRTHPEALRILDVVSAHHGDPLRSGTVALGDANAEPVTTPKAKRM